MSFEHAAHPDTAPYDALVNCHREPIRTPATIQRNGFLIIFDPLSFRILSVSRNCASLFQQELDTLLNQTIDNLFNEHSAHWIREQVGEEACGPCLDYIPLSLGKQTLEMGAFRYRELGFVEGLQSPPSAQNRLALNREFFCFVREVADFASNQALLECAASKIREFTGFDRVMIYRFSEDWHGEVITEQVGEGLCKQYEGLHFPETDIPAQARDLYASNRIRCIPAVDAEAVPLFPDTHPSNGQAFDLSFCHLRSVSPVHIQYLKNMGVRASMSVSIMVENQLWGLIACHHLGGPKAVSLDQQQKCLATAEVMASHILRIRSQRFNSRNNEAFRICNQLALGGGFSGEYALFNKILELKKAVIKLFAADGLEINIQNRRHRSGPLSISEEALKRIKPLVKQGMLITSNLYGLTGHHEPRMPAGIIFIGLNNDMDEYLCLMRREYQKEVAWAGEPLKLDQETGELRPRESFEIWREKVAGTSRHFEESDYQIAQIIRNGIVEQHATAEKVATQKQLEIQAMYDGLTGLPNRFHFNMRLTSELDKQELQDNPFALLFIDLDNFKRINDSLGHPVGDRILQDVSARLMETVSQTDFVARLSGDEFCVIADRRHTHRGIANLCERITANLSQPISVEEGQLFPGCSIGVTLSPEDGIQSAELTRKADLAMYQSKSRGKGSYTFFQPCMLNVLKDRQIRENEIRHAIAEHEFGYYYQPIVDVNENRIIGREALARWTHPNKGLLQPSSFIPLAEQMSLINEIDRQLILECGVLEVKEREDSPQASYLSVNVSATALINDSIRTLVYELEKREMDCRNLVFEITESTLISDPDKARSLLRFLTKRGIRVFLDDFGTGYSSLSYLNEFPVSGIKIDQSFVRQLHKRKIQKLVSSIVTIADNLDLSLLAEGVENESQKNMLLKLGCHIQQGFFYGKPMAKAGFDEFVKTYPA